MNESIATYDGHPVDIIGIDADKGEAIIKTETGNFSVPLRRLRIEREEEIVTRIFDQHDDCVNCELRERHVDREPYGDGTAARISFTCMVLDGRTNRQCPAIEHLYAQLTDKDNLAELVFDNADEVADVLADAMKNTHRDPTALAIWLRLADLFTE